MKKKEIKILTDGWGEALYRPFNKYLDNIKIFGMREDYGLKYNDFNGLFKMKKILEKDNFDVLFINLWPSILFLPFFNFKNQKIIFVSHGPHFPITFKFSLKISENLMIKLFIILTYPLFKLLYILGLKKVDLYFVVRKTLPLVTKNFSGIYLPITIDINEFKRVNSTMILDENYINIFYPTGLRDIKGAKFALNLMYKLSIKYPKIRFYIFKPNDFRYKKHKEYIDKISDKIHYLEGVTREKMVNLYSANWDLVLGAFYYEKFAAILNTIELEAMACKAPIIACDLNEIIFKPLDEIENLAYKIIDDKEFRKAYVEKNYKYVLKVHSTKNVAKIYEKYIEDL